MSNMVGENSRGDGGDIGGSERNKTFVCQVCNRCFGYKHVLLSHVRTHTGEKPFECRECHKLFTRNHYLKIHLRLHTGERPYHCTHCERHFNQKASLKSHMFIHKGEKPFECLECHKRFTRNDHMKNHMRMHTGEKPYHCTHCEQHFNQKASLKTHMFIHKGEKPFECVECHKRFTRNDHMKNHMRMHTGEKPYHCTHCERQFAFLAKMKAHLLIHTGDKPYECKKCLGRFRRRDQLISHKCSKNEKNILKPKKVGITKSYEMLTVQNPDPIQHISSPSMTIAVSLSNVALAEEDTCSKQYKSDEFESLSSLLSTTKQSSDLKIPFLSSSLNANSGSLLSDTSTVEFTSSMVAAKNFRSMLIEKLRQNIRYKIHKKDMTSDLATVTNQTPQQFQQLFNIQTQPLNLSLSSSFPTVIVPITDNKNDTIFM